MLGAFTADAAAMPFHWIYSQSQISSTLRGADPEFYGDPQCRWYDYSTGELSPFGQQGMVYLRTIAGSDAKADVSYVCLLYTSPSPRDLSTSRMPSSA